MVGVTPLLVFWITGRMVDQRALAEHAAGDQAATIAVSPWARLITGRDAEPPRSLVVSVVTALLLSTSSALLVGWLAKRELDAVRDYLQALAGARAGREPQEPAFRVAELAQISAAGRTMARAILSRQQELEILFDLDRALAEAKSPSDIARIAARHAGESLGFDGAAAFLLDASGQTLVLLQAHRLPDALVKVLQTLPLNRTLAGQSIAAGRPVVAAAEALADVLAPDHLSAVRDAGFATVVGVPCMAHGRAHGALGLYGTRALHLEESTLALLTSIGTQVALAIAHAVEQERLIEQERLAALGRLAAGVGHELRNPLTVILGRVQLMARQTNDPTAVAQHIGSLEEASMRMTRIMEGLSNYAKPVKPDPTVLHVDVLLRASVDLVAYQAHRSGVTITLDAPAGLPAIRAELSQMTQLLVNLATNAIEAMADHGGGALTLRARAENGTVRIEIADTGTGIPADKLALIWEPFYTTKTEGTGLGLSIVRGLVERQPGASITAQSTVGQGTVFTVTFPAHS
jgi:signal transduction histidine kinase